MTLDVFGEDPFAIKVALRATALRRVVQNGCVAARIRTITPFSLRSVC
jgi:hypothetical protein